MSPGDQPPGDADVAPDVQQFFATFERASGVAEVDALTECFADAFLVGDAQDARPVPRAAFLQALPTRFAAAANAGIGPAVLTGLVAEELDEHWVLARTRWSAPMAGGGTLPMASSFLLHRAEGVLRIAAYLNHEGLGLRPGTAPSD
jgi:hypothetical protein